jgi:hypothetical protein
MSNIKTGREPTESLNESWRVIPGYSAYEVSDWGRVRRRQAKCGWPAGHILHPGDSNARHRWVIIVGDDGRPKKQFVHRLVAMAFIGPSPFEGAMVLHHDDNPTHNRAENLYWGNHQQNVQDARLNRKGPGEPRKHGGQPGEANGAAVLTEQNVRDIKRYLKLGLCGSCIARIYGVQKESIYNIAKGRNWTHVTEASSPNMTRLLGSPAEWRA